MISFRVKFGFALPGIKEAREAFGHKHKFKPVTCRNLRKEKRESPNPFYQYDAPAGDYTEILQRCSCGETIVAELPGRWSMEELNGERPKLDVDKLIESTKAKP